MTDPDRIAAARDLQARAVGCLMQVFVELHGNGLPAALAWMNARCFHNWADSNVDFAIEELERAAVEADRATYDHEQEPGRNQEAP